jgi:glutaconyl-CoA/methylmalonyl-CoA decarboxylase subunit gamma
MKKYIVTVNGKKFEVEVEEAGAIGTVQAQAPVQEAPKAATPAPVAPAAPAAAPSSGQNAVKAPMPGTILDIKVSQGQSVKKGDVLFILEAMKMENEIMAGQDGTVVSVTVSKGSSVNTDDTLAILG